jgi:hypothetical protein
MQAGHGFGRLYVSNPPIPFIIQIEAGYMSFKACSTKLSPSITLPSVSVRASPWLMRTEVLLMKARANVSVPWLNLRRHWRSIRSSKGPWKVAIGFDQRSRSDPAFPFIWASRYFYSRSEIFGPLVDAPRIHWVKPGKS